MTRYRGAVMGASRAPSRLLLTAAVSVVGMSPRLAQACAVCFSASDETRDAFLGTTVFMTVLPLLMVGGVVVWMWRRALRIERASLPTTAQSQSRPQAAPIAKLQRL